MSTEEEEHLFETLAAKAGLRLLYVNSLTELDEACEALGVTDLRQKFLLGAYIAKLRTAAAKSEASPKVSLNL